MVKSPIIGLDTKTYWLTNRQSQCDFDFDFSASWIIIVAAQLPSLQVDTSTRTPVLLSAQAAGVKWQQREIRA
jgi:hypothetical protein